MDDELNILPISSYIKNLEPSVDLILFLILNFIFALGRIRK